MDDNGIQINVDLTKTLLSGQNTEEEETLENFLNLRNSHDAASKPADYFESENVPEILTSEVLSSVSTMKLNVPKNKPGESTFSASVFTSDIESRTDSVVSEISESFIGSGLQELVQRQEMPQLQSEVASFINTTVTSVVNTSTSNDSSLLLTDSLESWTSEKAGIVFTVTIMVLFILISNLFVIISVFRFRRLHTPTNYFITSLAVVDIFVAVATPFVVAVEMFIFAGEGVTPDNVVVCLLPNRMLMMTCGVSLLTLATIAYDRHTALACPLEYVNIMTARKVTIMVTITWLYSALIVWLPLMAGWYDVTGDITFHSARLLHGKAHLLFFTAIFLPSCLAILICYFRIFIVARHHAKAIAAVEIAVHRRLQVKFMIKDTKYAKTLALVIGVFLALWLPFLICMFIEALQEESFSVWQHTCLILLAVLNSGINPWIYAFKNNEFKAAFSRMYNDYVKNKLCFSGVRRSSLVSGASSTPRLSRTDSRMVSTIFEPTTIGSTSERLKRSLDSLDQFENEIGSVESVGAIKPVQAETGAHEATIKTINKIHGYRRNVVSCSDVDAVSSIAKKCAIKRKSVDFSLNEKSKRDLDFRIKHRPTPEFVEVIDEDDLPIIEYASPSPKRSFKGRHKSCESFNTNNEKQTMKKFNSSSSPGCRTSIRELETPVTNFQSKPKNKDLVLSRTRTYLTDLDLVMAEPKNDILRSESCAYKVGPVTDLLQNHKSHKLCSPRPASLTSSTMCTKIPTVTLPKVASSASLPPKPLSISTAILPSAIDYCHSSQSDFYSSSNSEGVYGDCSDSGVFDCHDTSASFHPYFQHVPNSCINLFSQSQQTCLPQSGYLPHIGSCPVFLDEFDSFKGLHNSAFVLDDLTNCSDIVVIEHEEDSECNDDVFERLDE